MDTGASKSYIKKEIGLPTSVPVDSPFIVKSLHGFEKIERKCELDLFGVKSHFFLLPGLKTFDGIVGLDLLAQVGATIDLKGNSVKFNGGREDLHFQKCAQVNFTKIEDIVVPPKVQEDFQQMMYKNSRAFDDPNEKLPFNTNVVATIRTEDNEPVYSKLYPFPMGASDFVNREIKDLLRNGIIRPSRSPYNNPIWVVGKKGTDAAGSPNKRLVVDFRKLNLKTIADRYPMPSINMILSNLGRSKFFTTLDLKSGYHQIELAESDREKTSFSVNGGKYEFCRLPFGLKNASSIFQRAIDDVLRDKIGKICYVYVDDVIVFSETEESHIVHIGQVLESLHKANMRVSRQKSKFLKKVLTSLVLLSQRRVLGQARTRSRPSRILNSPAICLS